MAATRASRKPPLDEQQQARVESWYPLAMELCRPWQARMPFIRDEIESEVHVTLVREARREDREIEEVGAYLNGMVRMAALAALRSARPLGFQRTGGDAPRVGSPEGLWSLPDPGNAMAEIEGRDFVEATLGKLPSRFGRVVDLVVLKDYSHKEAAISLGMPWRSVATDLRRAQGKMRENLTKPKREVA